MKRWAPLWLAIVALAPAAYAAEPELAIELPDVKLVLPRVSPPHFQQEGLPYLTENQLVLDLLTLVEREDYEGALARAKEDTRRRADAARGRRPRRSSRADVWGRDGCRYPLPAARTSARRCCTWSA